MHDDFRTQNVVGRHVPKPCRPVGVNVASFFVICPLQWFDLSHHAQSPNLQFQEPKWTTRLFGLDYWAVKPSVLVGCVYSDRQCNAPLYKLGHKDLINTTQGTLILFSTRVQTLRSFAFLHICMHRVINHFD